MIKKLAYCTLLAILLLNLNLQAIIIETSKIEDVFKYADKDSIVVFDVDSTLAEVECGVEYWISYKSEQLEKMGLSPDNACELVLYTFFMISRVAKLLPVNDSPRVVSKLQKDKIHTMALTNRSIPIAKRTIQLLKNIDINFSKNALLNGGSELNITHRGMFLDGVIFAGKNDKGRMLNLFFKNTNYAPKKLIYVDDRIEYVKSVEKEFDKPGVEFIGIRYSFMDEKKKNFDPVAAEKCINTFKVTLGLEPLDQTKNSDSCVAVIEKSASSKNAIIKDKDIEIEKSASSKNATIKDKDIVTNKNTVKSDNWLSRAWNSVTCPFKKAYKACF